MGRRTWIKIYVDPWLRKSLREETAELRGIWTDILTLAGDSAYGDGGTIQLAPGVGLTDSQIIDVLHLDPGEWERVKPRLQETDRIKVNGGNCIQIVNWARYQSEYERQKPYRKSIMASQKDTPSQESPESGSESPEVTAESYTPGLHGEREGERERDNIDAGTGQKTGFSVLWEHWMAQRIQDSNLIMSGDDAGAIRLALDSYSIDILRDAISAYGKILHGDEYLLTTRWGLGTFLNKHVGKFLPLSYPEESYARKKRKATPKTRILCPECSKKPDSERKKCKTCKGQGNIMR